MASVSVSEGRLSSGIAEGSDREKQKSTMIVKNNYKTFVKKRKTCNVWYVFTQKGQKVFSLSRE